MNQVLKSDTKSVHQPNTICEYCTILKPGYILKFTTFDQYTRHITKNHVGLPLSPTKGELDRFRQTVPPYEVKLRRHIRRELWRMSKYDRVNHILNNDYHPPERYRYQIPEY